MWYLSRGGAVEGPFSEEQLRAMQARGELAGTQLCAVGGTEWKPAETVMGPAQPAPQAGGWNPNAPPQGGPPPGYAGGTAVMQATPYGQPGPGQYGAPQGSPYGGPQQGGPPQYGGQPGASPYGAPQQGAPPGGQPPYGAAAGGQSPFAATQLASPDQAYGQPAQPSYGQAGPTQVSPPGQPQYGQPGQPQYGQPGQPQYGQPGQPQFGQPGQAQFGQPGQPQFGQPGAAPGVGAPAPAVDPNAPKKKGSPVVAIVIALVLLLVVGGGGALLYAKLGKPGAHLASSVPKDATIYAEMPSLKRSLLSLAGVKIFDSTKVDEKKTADDVTTAIVNSFGLSKSDAESLALSLDSVAVVARDVHKASAGAVLFSASSPAPVETLLKAKRFTADGTYGKEGKSYKLVAAPDGPATATPVEKSLRQMSTGSSKLVWFPSKKLLVAGDDAMIKSIAAVLEAGADSLEKRDAYIKAKKQFDSGADLVLFVDEELIKGSKNDADTQKLIAAYFKDGGPIDGAVKLSPAGVLMNGHMTLSGTALPADKTVSGSVKLTFPGKLPAETVAYFAGSTKTGMKGADAKAQLVKSLQGTDPTKAATLTQEMDAFEKSAGFTIADLFDMIGDEAAFALLVDKDFKYVKSAPLSPATFKGLGAAFVMQVDDEAVAKKILGKLKEKISDPSLAKMVSVKPDGDGFIAAPTADAAGMVGDGLPSLHVKYAKKVLAIVVAPDALMTRTFSAIEDGKGALKDDGAHESAMKALRSDAHGYMWIDLGRIVSLAYAADPQDKEDAKAFGVPVDAIKLTGPDRITAAMDFDYRVKDGEWTADIETLNLAGFSLMAGVDSPALSGAGGGGATPGTTPTDPTAPATGDPTAPGTTPAASALTSTGVQTCDDYLARLSSCGKNIPQAHDAYVKAAQSSHDAWMKIPAARRKSLGKQCTALMASLDKNPTCK